jgi:tRNA1(Val) A37 N6-methylase TrmN6
MGMSNYKELATIIAAISLNENGHIRVKELFESFEAFKFISNYIVTAQRTRKTLNQPPLNSIIELACGHGLVGLLLAYRFPNLKVHLYDLKQRPSFETYLKYYFISFV